MASDNNRLSYLIPFHQGTRGNRRKVKSILRGKQLRFLKTRPVKLAK